MKNFRRHCNLYKIEVVVVVIQHQILSSQKSYSNFQHRPKCDCLVVSRLISTLNARQLHITVSMCNHNAKIKSIIHQNAGNEDPTNFSPQMLRSLPRPRPASPPVRAAHGLPQLSLHRSRPPSLNLLRQKQVFLKREDTFGFPHEPLKASR